MVRARNFATLPPRGGLWAWLLAVMLAAVAGASSVGATAPPTTSSRW